MALIVIEMKYSFYCCSYDQYTEHNFNHEMKWHLKQSSQEQLHLVITTIKSIYKELNIVKCWPQPKSFL